MNRSFYLVLLAPLIFALVASPGWADEEEEGLAWATDSDVGIDIEIISGEIEIKGWDRDEVRVDIDDEIADRLKIDRGKRRIKIRSTGRRGRRLGWGSLSEGIDFEIYVPAQSRIDARTVNGEIRSEGVDGTLDLNAANGQIEVRGNPKKARLETLNSSIQFEGESSDIDARTLNGSIELRGVTGDVTASTMSGSIKVEGESLDRVDLKTHSGSIELKGRLLERARARLKSFSGSIRVEIPSTTSARFDIQSFSGSIQNELGATTRRERTRRRGERLEFTTSDGDGRVHVETFSGAVEIKAND